MVTEEALEDTKEVSKVTELENDQQMETLALEVIKKPSEAMTL
jgi:hypothetical protein